MRTPLLALLSFSTLVGCVANADDAANVAQSEDDITAAHAWYRLDAASGLGPATLSVVNGYKVKCPNGASSKTCQVSALVLPADCNFECQDGLLGLQGDSIVKGHFQKGTFVVEQGLDTWRAGLGSRSVYRITGAPTCAADPCPTGLRAQKLNNAGAPTSFQSVDFSHADDVNYVLDPTRGDDQAASDVGLLASGKIVAHVFQADRVWRLETPKPACEPQLVARGHVFLGDATSVLQFRTTLEAERATDPNGGSVAWLVRTGETSTQVSFTSGLNDLWVERFDVAKSDCAVHTTAEH